jgi:uncharacterized protein (DUF1697 family)
MSKNIAFLRAINVGGHTVKMTLLQKIFTEMGFSNAETFIASGNVVFDRQPGDPHALEKTIGLHLREALGYEVAVFIRNDFELAAIANDIPFSQSALDAAAALNVAFISEPLDQELEHRLMALETDIDDIQIRQREIYWLCRKKQSESTFSNALLEKTTGRPSTIRGINTLRKLVEKYTPAVE